MTDTGGDPQHVDLCRENDTSSGRPSDQAVAAEMRYVRHFTGRIVADNGAESEFEAAIADSLEGNADFENLQTPASTRRPPRSRWSLSAYPGSTAATSPRATAG